MSSDELELVLKTNFMEALKDSSLRSFSFSSSVRCLLIKQSDVPTGILIYREIEPKNLAEIDFVAVSIDCRGQGLASSLIADLSLKYREIWLELSSGNSKAMSLYLKHGFSIHGERSDYYGKGRHAVNMIKIRAV